MLRGIQGYIRVYQVINGLGGLGFRVQDGSGSRFRCVRFMVQGFGSRVWNSRFT